MKKIHVRNARVFDSVNGGVSPPASIVIDDGKFLDVIVGGTHVEAAIEIDAQGRVATPGLIDCHVHVTAVDHDAFALAQQPPSLITAKSKSILEGMLQRGFTTVRDAAGADFGLREAVEKGHFVGPRLFISGWPISQTGGHGDFRRQGMQELVCTCAGLGLFGAIADGEAAVRKAVREQLRNGANQIKVMAGGGVASPTDPIDGTQYSIGELRAIVEEAEAANTYVLAHAYSPRAITRAVDAGIRTIEHGNLLDEHSARSMRAHAAILVPTLATYAALFSEGQRLGWSAAMLEKLERVRAAGLNGIRLARSEGVPVAFGTDLLGEMHALQSSEFTLRAEVLTATEILQSATSVAAQLLRQEGVLGVIASGAVADLLIMDGDPSQDCGVLADPQKNLRLVMQGGRIAHNFLS
jgi:imidazolonepropionase-like amidohydrolase